MNSSPLRSDPKRPPVTTRTTSVKEAGTPPVRSSLCTPQLALSTAVRNSHNDGVRRIAVEEQLGNMTILPAVRVQLHLPPLDFSAMDFHSHSDPFCKLTPDINLTCCVTPRRISCMITIVIKQPGNVQRCRPTPTKQTG